MDRVSPTGNALSPLQEDDPLFPPTPAAGLLGRDVVGINREAGEVHIRYFARPDFSNRHGSVQGGLLSAMLDSATALALYVQLPPDLTALTTRLDTSFLRPAPLGHLDVHARVIGRTDRDGEVLGEVHDAEGRVLAKATATLRILPRKR